MLEEAFYRYNPWWEEKYLFEGLIERELVLSILKKQLSSRQIVFLTGLRRVGKTSLLRLLIKSLISVQKINPRDIFYVSLDDYQISKLSIIDLIEKYRKIHKIPFKQKIYLFLDEIVYQENFELQLKNLYDSQNMKIYASSSSASILKSKKPFLTGRNFIIEVLPLDFEEYLNFKQIKISKSDHGLQETYFEDYMKTGGLPEYVLYQEIEYLKELVDDIIYKDIVALHGVKDPSLLKELFLLLMERVGKIASINKLARILKISPDTVKRYLQMFADTYLIYLVPRFGKTNENILAPKKIYSCDLGVKTFFSGFRDKGSLFENYVYLKIKNKNPHYVYHDGLEIDFITKEKTLIEVKYKDEIKEKQKVFFDKFKAKKKILIQSIYDIKKLAVTS